MLLVAAFAGGVFFDRTLADATEGGRRSSLVDTEVDDAVAEVADIIESLALEPSSEESMTIGAINGMLESLEDSHAVYFTAEQYEYFNEQNMGTFYGIGITISNDGDDLVVNSVIEGTPAARAGLQPGDVIVEIDGEARPRWDVDEAVLRIRGEEGTTVVLGIRREGAGELIDYTIERAKIDVPNVESEMLKGDIGYVSLVSFTQVAAEDVRSAIEELEAEGARGFVLDLRNNPGSALSVRGCELAVHRRRGDRDRRGPHGSGGETPRQR